MSESNRPTPDDDTPDRTFNDEQQPLFESGGDAEKTRQRTPGTQSVPPRESSETDDAPPGVGDVG